MKFPLPRDVNFLPCSDGSSSSLPCLPLYPKLNLSIYNISTTALSTTEKRSKRFPHVHWRIHRTHITTEVCTYVYFVSSKLKVRKEYQDIGFSRTQSVAKRDVNFRAIFFVFISHFISFLSLLWRYLWKENMASRDVKKQQQQRTPQLQPPPQGERKHHHRPPGWQR